MKYKNLYRDFRFVSAPADKIKCTQYLITGTSIDEPAKVSGQWIRLPSPLSVSTALLNAAQNGILFALAMI